MSRSGYHDSEDQWDAIRWSGAVKSTIRGKRGQAFLREMLNALDTVANGALITGALEKDGAVCALGAVGKARGLDMLSIDPYDPGQVTSAFRISRALAAEITYENDEAVGYWCNESPEARFARMREWIESRIKTATA